MTEDDFEVFLELLREVIQEVELEFADNLTIGVED